MANKSEKTRKGNNTSTLAHFRLWILASLSIFLVGFFLSSSFGAWQWAGTILNLVVMGVGYFLLNGAAARDEDLGTKGSIAEYIQDLLYISCVVLAGSMLTNLFYLAWLAVLCYGGVKLWQLVISPWIFSEAPAAPAAAAAGPAGPESNRDKLRNRINESRSIRAGRS
eukprot:m.233114 g.233114  ORF g.233114 m.233114 type:complete len:168 (-) comp18986_c0_seq1:25-528(-)